ncbi:hypothetical protein [Umezawaea sp. Da 62-37]|uniref:hypothetical protein n=1 Tax=Umezawaea sp. Da 62-37 TaxID=3075927 RepID=UPI0028F74B8D|nr:hypothetical protein [Umezawaea sp. Da 62-37]WNV83056.1 hypothetical protein RM788_33360 [Umezawaea sp. Da 62-37]
MTVKLLGHLRTVLGLAGPVAVFLLQPIPEIPPLSRYALAAFVLTGVSTYLYTFWTGRPRIARIPGAEASGWLGVVGIPTSERTPERYLEHYVLRAITPIRAYAAEAADNGDIAHGRHLRNQHSNLGLAAVMLTGVVCAVLLVLRW